MQQHPFVQDFSNGLIFPSQNVPLSRKTQKWKEANMDAIEAIGKAQFARKQKLLNNYKLINGELIESEYVDVENGSENFDVLDYVSDKLSLPGFVKNYDIIGQPVRTLEGEMDAFPDVFNVVGKGDIFDNERTRVKTDLLKEWFMNLITTSINAKLGYASTPQFEDEEQQAQYEQQVKALTPPEIESYMRTSYRHVVEEWGQNELEDQFERFKIKALRRKEFHHYLVAGERYRHLYTNAKGLMVESLNPLYTFSIKSPDIDNVQDGDLAGIVKILSVPAVIDRFGHLMTDRQINSLEAPYQSSNESDLGKHVDGTKIDYLSPLGVPYQTRVPTLNPEVNKFFPNMMSNVGGGSVASYMSEEELSKINGQSSPDFFTHIGANMLVVTIGYWRSQRRIGKLTTWNEEIRDFEITIVDENYVVPDHIKQIKNELRDYNAGVDTLVWTRETQIWEGIKINNYNTVGVMKEPIYLKVQPAEIQIGKLLIAGQYANNINTKPTSIVDRLKPWQFFFNVLINQCYHFFETELAPFLLLSSEMIPNQKDWGGEDGVAKWLESARAGATIADLAPTSAGNPINGGQFPKVIDLDMASRIMSRMQLAIQIKQFALEQVGISPQRLGDVDPRETATGVQQGISNSHTQTSTWFTSFFECEKDILQMQLDAAKNLQASGKEFSVQTVKSDLSIQALKFAAEDGYLYDLHVYVSDSQEELRNIELAKQLALNNNTSEMQMSDRIDMATSSSVREIVNKLKFSEEKAIERMQQEMQLKQQELEQSGMDAQAARETAERQFQAKLANDLQIAIIRALGNSRDNDIDQDNNSDVLEYAALLNSSTQIDNENSLNLAKLQLEQNNQDRQYDLENRKLMNEREKRISDQVIADKKIKQAKIAGDKSK